MRLTSKGQVTIPLEIRKTLGLLPDTEVVFDVVDGSVRIRKAPAQRRGRALVDTLRGTASTRFSTDQILALTRR